MVSKHGLGRPDRVTGIEHGNIHETDSFIGTPPRCQCIIDAGFVRDQPSATQPPVEHRPVPCARILNPAREMEVRRKAGTCGKRKLDRVVLVPNSRGDDAITGHHQITARGLGILVVVEIGALPYLGGIKALRQVFRVSLSSLYLPFPRSLS